MIPLSDPDIHRRSTPYVTGALLVASVLVFLHQLSLDDLGTFLFTYKYAAIPAEVLGGEHLSQIPVFTGQGVRTIDVTSPIPDWATMFTSMFMHAGFLHLAGNMLYLWAFGKSIEDRFGHLAYLVFYLLAGVVAVVAHSLVDSSSFTPMVGASGAIAGVLGAYLLLYPFSRINTLLFFGLIMSFRVPAIVLLGFWAAIQYFNGVASLGPEVSSGGVAYFAHIGGARLTKARLGVGGSSPPATGPRQWATVSCPECGTDILDFEDGLHRWYCRRCDLYFS